MSGEAAATNRRTGSRASRTAKRRCGTQLSTFLLLCGCLLAPLPLAAQGYQVTGRVVGGGDNAAEHPPLTGVGVNVKHTSAAVVTNATGNYVVLARTENDTLVFTLLGYKTQEVPIAGRNRVDVVLEQEVYYLDPLVVVGYGVQKKATMSGSVAVVQNTELARTPAVTTADALVGKVQGITTRLTNNDNTTGDARPGNTLVLQIRNMGTPLFIIDGVPQTEGQFNQINAADIEGISILKDASASVYGFRASNGVVLVTTKQGQKNQRPQITVDGYYGLQSLTTYPFDPPANAYQFKLGWLQSQQNRGQAKTITPEELEKWRLGTEPGFESFNQYDYVINQPQAPQWSLNASASGGGSNSTYYLSVGHVSQDYVMKDNNFNRTNFQSNLRVELSDRLAIGAQLSGRQEVRDNVAIPGRDDVVYTAMLGINSSWPVDNPYANGNRNYVNGNVRYLGRLASTYFKDVAGWQLDTWRNAAANVFAEYRFPFGLQAKATYAYTYRLHNYDRQRFSYDSYCYDPLTDTYPVCMDAQGNKKGYYSPQRDTQTEQTRDQFAQLQLTQQARFGEHNLSGTMAWEITGGESDGTSITSIPTLNYSKLIQFATVNDASSSWGINRRESFIGRFNYDFASKYLVEVLGRYDGSYLYAPGHRWGLFPGMSLGWRISEEGFFKDHVRFIDDLKLRTSWGQAGREQGVSAWGYLVGSTYNSGSFIFNGQVVTGADPRGLPVTNLSWVKSTSRNVGFDVVTLKRKLRGEFDLFERELSGIPASRYDVLLPSEVGYSLPNENLNSDAVRGVEGMVTFTNRIGAVNYTLNANATLARSMNLERYKPRYANSWDEYRNSVVQRWADVSFGYHCIGQFQSMEEIENYPVNIDGQGNRTLLPGDLIYEDVNKDGIINSMDQRPIGYGINQNPIFAFGFGGSVDYGRVSLTMAFAGGAMYSHLRDLELKSTLINDHNSPEFLMTDVWHRADPFDDNSEWIAGKYPPIRRGLTSHSSYLTSDFWRTNVHYLRLKRAELGYQLPEALLGRVGLNTARIYVSGANLLTFDNLKAIKLDPEIAMAQGLRYPTQRVINLGVSATLGGNESASPARPATRR